jgi:hypothetical protein
MIDKEYQTSGALSKARTSFLKKRSKKLLVFGFGLSG